MTVFNDEEQRVFTFYESQFFRSRLIINENLQINFPTEMPNRFWRFWQWVLLGWRWESPEVQK